MSTSKLQREVAGLIALNLPNHEVIENCRPEWLITPEGNRLELDFLVESLDLAIEVQGAQHFEYVPFFHGEYEKFEERKAFDNFKRETCKARGITLFEVEDYRDCDELLKTLRSIVLNSKGGEWTEINRKRVMAIAGARDKVRQTEIYASYIEAYAKSMHAKDWHKKSIAKGKKAQIKFSARVMHDACREYKLIRNQVRDMEIQAFLEIMNT